MAPSLALERFFDYCNPMSSQKGIKFICDLCGQMIEVGRPRFIFKGELFCAYDGGKFDETSDIPQESFADEMKRLIAAMEKRTEKDLNDEVHYQYEMDLCPKCRIRIYNIIEKKENE